MGVEELVRQNEGRREEVEKSFRPEAFFQEVKSPRGKRDGCDLHHVPGVDQRSVFRCDRKDEPTNQRPPHPDTEEPAKAVDTGCADEKLKHDVPRHVGRSRENPEDEVAEKEELLRGHPPFVGVSGVYERIPPGAGEVNPEDGPKRPVAEILHPPVELVEDIRSSDYLRGEEDL